MLKMILLLAIPLGLALSSPAQAQQQAATESRDAHGYTFTLCDAETTAGPTVCEGAGGDIYAVVDRFRQFGIFYTATDNASTCDIYALDGSQTIVADLTTLDIWKINGTAFTNSTPVQWFEITAKYLFASCTVASGSVTITMMASEPTINRTGQ